MNRRAIVSTLGFPPIVIVTLLLLIVTFLLLLGASLAQAQPSPSPASVELKDGPMVAISEKVLEILVLKTDEQNGLQLDRSRWDESGDDQDAMLDANIKKLLDRGFDPQAARKFAERMNQARSRGPLGNWFTRLREYGLTSVGFSSSGNVSTVSSGNDEIRCVATFSGSDFKFEIAETGGRQLSFVSTDNILRIILSDDERIAILTQSKTGKVTGVLTGETILTGSADNYLQFGIEHRELDQTLKQVFRQVGVDFPPTPQDISVQQNVISRIRATFSDNGAVLDELIQKLDSSDFAAREAATREIEAGISHFKPLVSERLNGDSLTPEAKLRLGQVLKKAQNEPPVDARIAQCVESNRLLESPGYLVGLLDGLTEVERVPITKLLAKLTGEDFGDDVEAWQNWSKAGKNRGQ